MSEHPDRQLEEAQEAEARLVALCGHLSDAEKEEGLSRCQRCHYLARQSDAVAELGPKVAGLAELAREVEGLAREKYAGALPWRLTETLYELLPLALRAKHQTEVLSSLTSHATKKATP